MAFGKLFAWGKKLAKGVSARQEASVRVKSASSKPSIVRSAEHEAIRARLGTGAGKVVGGYANRVKSGGAGKVVSQYTPPIAETDFEMLGRQGRGAQDIAWRQQIGASPGVPGILDQDADES